MISCSLCLKSFSRIDARTRHIRTVHLLKNNEKTPFDSDQNGLGNIQPNEEAMRNDGRQTEEVMSVDDGQNEEVMSDDESSNDENDSGDEADDEEEDDSETEARDIFIEDDEELSSDASITSSSEENNETDEDAEEDGESVTLKWPDTKYFLSSRWVKYGSRKIKLEEHIDWLENILRMSDAQILKRIKTSSDGEIKVLCEIALNILLGNVYPYKADKTFLLKNKNLLRAMSSNKVSIERKRLLIYRRGADFTRRIIGIITPLFENFVEVDE